MTAVVIILFMPRYSYWAAAFGHLASYIVMFVISSVLGAKYYPIPYRWGRLALIFIMMGVAYGTSLLLDRALFTGFDISTASTGKIVAKLGLHTALIAAYLAGVWVIIRKSSVRK